MLSTCGSSRRADLKSGIAGPISDRSLVSATLELVASTSNSDTTLLTSLCRRPNTFETGRIHVGRRCFTRGEVKRSNLNGDEQRCQGKNEGHHRKGDRGSEREFP